MGQTHFNITSALFLSPGDGVTALMTKSLAAASAGLSSRKAEDIHASTQPQSWKWAALWLLLKEMSVCAVGETGYEQRCAGSGQEKQQRVISDLIIKSKPRQH